MIAHNSRSSTPRHLLVLSPALYLSVRLVVSPGFWNDYLADYALHSLTFFASFLLLPLILLHRSGNVGIFAGRRQFLAGFLSYIPLTVLFTLLFGNSLGPRGEGVELLKSILLVSVNVSSVDFYVFRICGDTVKLPISPAFTTIVWFLIHVPESLWLIDHGFGCMAVLSFMALSGAFLSLVYWKTGDVGGMMAGHVFLNLALAAT